MYFTREELINFCKTFKQPEFCDIQKWKESESFSIKFLYDTYCKDDDILFIGTYIIETLGLELRTSYENCEALVTFFLVDNFIDYDCTCKNVPEAIYYRLFDKPKICHLEYFMNNVKRLLINHDGLDFDKNTKLFKSGSLNKIYKNTNGVYTISDNRCCINCESSDYCRRCINCKYCRYCYSCVNCEYCNSSDNSHNCISTDNSSICENCTQCDYCVACINCTNCIRFEFSKECNDCENCAKCNYCSACVNCRDCTQCENSKKCNNCENCTNCNQCSECNNCTNCNKCSDCIDCTGCKHCKNSKELCNCKQCKFCEDCLNCVKCLYVSKLNNSVDIDDRETTIWNNVKDIEEIIKEENYKLPIIKIIDIDKTGWRLECTSKEYILIYDSNGIVRFKGRLTRKDPAKIESIHNMYLCCGSIYDEHGVLTDILYMSRRKTKSSGKSLSVEDFCNGKYLCKKMFKKYDLRGNLVFHGDKY